MKILKMAGALVLLTAALAAVPVFAGAGREPAGNERLHLVYITPLISHPVWLIAKDGFDQAVAELGIRGDWVGPQTLSPESMSRLMDTAIVQRAGGIITQGMMPPGAMRAAASAGIPVILVDNDQTDATRLAFFGKDVDIQAKLLYADILEKLGPNTRLNVAIQVASLSFEVAHNMVNAVEREFARHPGGFQIVSLAESRSDKNQSIVEWERTFNAYPEVNVALGFAAEIGAACALVVREMGIRNRMLLYGVDDIDETLEVIRSGELDGAIVLSFFNYGYQAAYWLYQHITQGRRPANIFNDAGTVLVTRSNIDSYAAAHRIKADLPLATE